MPPTRVKCKLTDILKPSRTWTILAVLEDNVGSKWKSSIKIKEEVYRSTLTFRRVAKYLVEHKRVVKLGIGIFNQYSDEIWN